MKNERESNEFLRLEAIFYNLSTLKYKVANEISLNINGLL